MMRAPLALCAAATLAIGGSVAHADPIVVDVGAEWRHVKTGFVFSPEASGFERISVENTGEHELDVAVSYSDPATQTTASVYLFHAGLADASIWHDRILAVMANADLGTFDNHQLQTELFTPPSGQSGSGIRTVVPLSGMAARATGIAIYPSADWLLAVRMTSRALDAAALDARLATFVTHLPAPETPIEASQAYLIQACANALPQKRAKFYKPTTMDAFLGATTGTSSPEEPYDEAAIPAKRAQWCRDPSSTKDYGVYRSKGTKKGYIVAVSDAGMTASVGRETLSGAISGSSAPSYQMILRTVDHAYAYPRFTRLPAVDQVVALIFKGQPISSATRGMLDTTINLPSGLGEEDGS